MLINEDFPTFDLPINAYSGMGSFGHLLTSELLMMNSAVLIFIVFFIWGKGKQKKEPPFKVFSLQIVVYSVEIDFTN
jgi:hypothetical protein